MSVLQYTLRRILVPNYNLMNLFIFPVHANCAPQFVGLETQCITLEIIDSHIKLINNLIILMLILY